MNITTVGIIIFILFSHFISDFVLQTRKMANNKSSSIKWLSIHVGVYTVSLLTLCALFHLTFGLNVVLWVLLNGVLHWVTDFFTSRATTKLYKQQKHGQFFMVIGFDQFIHTATLIGTMPMWL